MKLPKKVRICGIDYIVKKDNMITVNQGCVGISKAEQAEILMAIDGLDPQKVEQTFFHEVLHAVDCHFNCSKLGEEQVNLIANGLYQVLRDNNFLNTKIFNA